MTIGDGYICQRCGLFVFLGAAHECQAYYLPSYNNVFVPECEQQLNKIIELLEAILEKIEIARASD